MKIMLKTLEKIEKNTKKIKKNRICFKNKNKENYGKHYMFHENICKYPKKNSGSQIRWATITYLIFHGCFYCFYIFSYNFL